MEHLCEQYGEDWTRLRLGKPTASRFADIITPLGKPTVGKERRKYMFRLIAERMLGQAMDDGFENAWMRRGSDLEEQALVEFQGRQERWTGRKAGFFTGLNDMVGASPDYIINERTGVGLEIKCPAPYTMIEYLIDGPGDRYKAQVQGQLMVCEWQTMHFFAWHPSMPSVRIIAYRDEPYIAKLTEALEEFCDQLDEYTDFVRGKGMFKLAEKLRLSDELKEWDSKNGAE